MLSINILLHPVIHLPYSLTIMVVVPVLLPCMAITCKVKTPTNGTFTFQRSSVPLPHMILERSTPMRESQRSTGHGFFRGSSVSVAVSFSSIMELCPCSNGRSLVESLAVIESEVSVCGLFRVRGSQRCIAMSRIR